MKKKQVLAVSSALMIGTTTALTGLPTPVMAQENTEVVQEAIVEENKTEQVPVEQLKQFDTNISDVNITIPMEAVLPQADTPEVMINKTATSITATVTNYKKKFGNVEYQWDDGSWEKDRNTLSNLKPDTPYKLAIRFTGSNSYQMSEEYRVEVHTLKDGLIGFYKPSSITDITYREGLKLSNLALPQGWSWVAEDTSLSAGTKSYPAVFDTTNLESTTDFSRVEGYDKDTHKVTSNVNVKVDKATNIWVEELSIEDWTYGERAKTPKAKAQFGKITFKYSSEENGTYTSNVPVNAGAYYVKAIVAEDENYTGLESVVKFEIAKAIPTYEKVTGLVLGQGQPLSKIKLPEHFKWINETVTADEFGMHTFKAIYTPEDTANYQTIEVDIEVEVIPTSVVLNHLPTIHVNDKTVTVGDTFDPLANITATDKEDGTITLTKDNIIANDVDISKAGIYHVTYKVTDKNGASTEKTITVTVKEKTTSKPVSPQQPQKPNKPTTSTKPIGQKNPVKTGDVTNVGLFASMFAGSTGALAVLCGKKRKRNKND